MSSVFNKMSNPIHWVSRGFFYIGWVVVVVMMLTTCYDVMMRYLFARPTIWAVEMNAILMVYIAFLCGGELARNDQHIDMDVLFTRLSKRTQKRIELLIAAAVLLFCIVLFWMGGRAAISTFKYGMYTAGEFHMPLWLVYISIPIGALFIGLEYLLQIIGSRKAD